MLSAFGFPGGAFPGWDAESLKKLRGLSGKRELGNGAIAIAQATAPFLDSTQLPKLRPVAAHKSRAD